MKKKFFDSVFSLESDEMTALWPNDSWIFTFYVLFSKSIPNWGSLVKEVFYSMFCLESYKMTAMWPNDSLTFTFYVSFSKSIPNWASLVKEVFWFNVLFRKCQNDCYVTKWQVNFHFLCNILKKYTKINNFCKRSFLISCSVYIMTYWLFCDQMTA